MLLNLISSFKSGLIGERIKWTDLENTHITLAFPGNTEEDRIKPIQKMLAEKCKGFGKFEIKLRGSGLFRNINDPRVIWAGISPSDNLLRLNRDIITGLSDAGIVIEDRPFNPHLTLGRIKSISNKEALAALLDNFRNKELQVIPVNEVILYESILKATGPVYKPIAKFLL